MLTEKTLDKADAAGRFRLPTENVNVVDSRTSEIVFTPPPAESVAGRIGDLCAFANTKSKPFVHPVIKAIALHFAIGFIHPFVDGNGRTARAIFYWYLLKSGYWMFEYLPISRIILDAPIKYSRAYLYTESDDGDLTYFNHFHLKVIVRAIDDLHAYLSDQRRQIEQAEEFVEEFPSLNLRQRLLLEDALKHPKNRYTITEHAGEYRVTYNTARADLSGLVDAGLFVRGKIKKEWTFRPAPDLLKKLSR